MINLRQRLFSQWIMLTFTRTTDPWSFAWAKAARCLLYQLDNNGDWPTGEASDFIHEDPHLIGDFIERARELEQMPRDGWTFSHGPLDCPKCCHCLKVYKDHDPGYAWCNYCFHRGTAAEFEAAYRESLEMYSD